MGALNDTMKRLITDFNIGVVATVNEDGTPAASPKGTFVVVDDDCIAFGNIRSPGTADNIRARADIEVNFIDVLKRRAVRVKGKAAIVEKSSDDGAALMPHFESLWAPYIEHMENFVRITIDHAELILSPAYDLGHTAAELRQSNMDKLAQIT